MKKLCVLPMLLALCLMMTGCITINVQAPQSAVDSLMGLVPEQADGVVVDALPTENAEEDLIDEDLIEEEPMFNFDDLEMVWENERTLMPATPEDQIEGVQVDYVVQNDKFSAQIDEMVFYSEEFVNKNIAIEGYVMLYPEANPDTNFAIVREVVDEEDVHEGEEIDDLEHMHMPYLTGFDCRYDGELPPENAWIKIVGTLLDYVYTDPDIDGEIPALMLDVQYLEVGTAPEGNVGMPMETLGLFDLPEELEAVQ